MARIDVDMAKGLPAVCCMTGESEGVLFHEVWVQKLPASGSPAIAALMALFARLASRRLLYRRYRIELPFSAEGHALWKRGERLEQAGDLTCVLSFLGGVALLLGVRGASALGAVGFFGGSAIAALALMAGKVARANELEDAPRLVGVKDQIASFEIPNERFAEAVRDWKHRLGERARRKSAAMKNRLAGVRERRVRAPAENASSSET